MPEQNSFPFPEPPPGSKPAPAPRPAAGGSDAADPAATPPPAGTPAEAVVPAPLANRPAATPRRPLWARFMGWLADPWLELKLEPAETVSLRFEGDASATAFRTLRGEPRAEQVLRQA